mgnify:CR=1 FL=1
MNLEIDVRDRQQTSLSLLRSERRTAELPIKQRKSGQQRPDWRWQDCPFVIQQNIAGNAIFWSLESTLAFSSPLDP